MSSAKSVEIRKDFAKFCEKKEPNGDGLIYKYFLSRSFPKSHKKTSTGKRAESIFRSSHRRCSVKKGVLKNFEIFTGKHLFGVPLTSFLTPL